MSTKDHPDWWTSVGGANAQDSTLERRSLVWNDDDILDGTVPATFYEAVTYKGKFYTRGCRGMMEQIQLYCIGDAVDTITIRYSPHPCLGPFGAVTIVPAAAWAWQPFVIEEMWDYDSLFIWVYAAEANVDWAYDAVQPYDGHLSTDAGATWEDMAIRPFIRVVYTGETPGDVPVSGIINNIQIPNVSSQWVSGNATLAPGVPTVLYTLEGAGTIDFQVFSALAAVASEQVQFSVYCDGNFSFYATPIMLNGSGYIASTPGISLLTYLVDGDCYFIVTKKFEFRRSLEVRAMSIPGGMFVESWGLPTLMR